MTIATLDAVELGIWRALAGLVVDHAASDADDAAPQIATSGLPTTQRPLRFVKRFAGEFSRVADDVQRGLYELRHEQYPAALLAFVRSVPVGSDGVYVRPILDGADEPDARMLVQRAHFRVFVASGDTRGDAAALLTAVAGQTAALTAARRVAARLARTHIAGVLDEVEEAGAAGDTTALTAANRAFHFAIHTAFSTGSAMMMLAMISASSSTKIAPASRSSSTTCLLWTISLRT